MHQKSVEQMELPLEARGEAPTGRRSGEAGPTTQGIERLGLDTSLMERVVERGNLVRALQRVRQNKGSPGVDGRTVDDLPGDLREHWYAIREQLLTGRYQPSAVKRVEIPKPGGGVRLLGIPTVLDRFIQQAVLQVLQPAIDATFSESSYGFRPGRRAHDAVCQAQRFVQSGRRWVVDVDLEKFFDRVNHDVLMGLLHQRIADSRMLRLIRRYLNAGVLADGVVMDRHEGTPQGGPLSPLLANVLLDDIDKKLERADTVLCGTRTTATSMSGRSGRRSGCWRDWPRSTRSLNSDINIEKSAVAPARDRQFLATASGMPRGARSNAGCHRKP